MVRFLLNNVKAKANTLEGVLHSNKRNVIVKESFVKYLAGVIDADGSLSFKFTKLKSGNYSIHLRLYVASSEAVDRNHLLLRTIHKETKCGTLCLQAQKTSAGAWTGFWQVQDKPGLEKLVPRLVKHLVIKARHFQRMLTVYCELSGNEISEQKVEELKVFAKESRLETGPLKPKKHPTYAWIAGYVDGDGTFSNRRYPKHRSNPIFISVVTHQNDRVGVDLLFKAFGGKLFNAYDKPHLLRWQHNLGPRDASFALTFLPLLLRYSIVKKHSIEQILHLHHQRLTEGTPTGEVIVQVA